MSSDESVRRHVMGTTGDHHGRPTAARMVDLSKTEALRLLAGVTWGRVVFSLHALPAVRPVNHILDDRHIIIRAHPGAAILRPAGTGKVVAYEADQLDETDHTGWSVIVTGTATLVRDPDQLARYELLLHPWTDGAMEHVVRISPHIVTGHRLTREP
ncbi:pyridoxamine 5'-phosphate oxidase family protein [Actinacidiphila soli]|uniref:pyridoxamine 5'-phosphate oxidase family protein n=1 Tax=Actinacidiphila soli TaxID=2487275 RepID=UPI001F0BC56F|nr:pyridoxamine 5'-phosphate oxidase family protein [Actinacidiphila soli]